MASTATSPPRTRDAELRRGVALEYASLLYTLVETVVGLLAGVAAGSVALIGFGLDSLVESSSAAVVLWRLRAERAGGRSTEDLERRAIRLISLAFFALAAYVGIRSVVDLAQRSQPDDSAVGIGLAAVSVVVMPLLAWGKRKVARALDSRSLQADSRQTSLCTYISGFVLVGLAANWLFGWWWADPVAGLAIAALALQEGRELWRTEDLCCP